MKREKYSFIINKYTMTKVTIEGIKNDRSQHKNFQYRILL